MDPLVGYAITGSVSLTVGILVKYFEPKGKIFFWWPHTFRFKPRADYEIQTDALTIQNLGRRSVEDVEIIMQSRPDCFDFSPPIPYEEATTSDGHFVFRVKSLAPKEFFTLQILSYTKIPNVVNIRSKAGKAERLPFQIQRIYPKWQQAIIIYLFMTGFGLTLYWVFRIISEILLKT
jgi:hypothetical protein